MPDHRWIASLAFLALAGATSCGGNQSTGGEAARSRSAAATPSPTGGATPGQPDTPLHGSWRLQLSEGQLGAALAAGGYGDLTEEFLAAEQIRGAITQVLTVDADRFGFAYQSGDGPWHIGWQGPVAVAGDTVTLQDDLSPSKDTLRWVVDGDQLTFELVDASDVVLKGIPNAAYLHAYLTAAPFVRTDCVPTSGGC